MRGDMIMKLENTERLLKAKLAAGEFDTYAVMAGFDDGKGNDRVSAIITSPGTGVDTYFDIASMGKVLVTSTLALHAVSEGRLSLDDKLTRFFKVPSDKSEITIRQILTHTSGILRRELPDETVAGGREAIIDFILSTPLGFNPGEHYCYSCSAYLLLGYLLEIIYGMTLDRIFDKYIKKPLGLTRAAFNIPVNEPDVAVTYYRAEPGDCLVADSIVYKLKGVAGNGASFWTLADIRRFIGAVLSKNEKLYPEEYFALAEQNYTKELEESWGLGYLFVDERYTQTGRLFPSGSFGHCGNTGTSFFMNRENGLYTIILTNATRFSYMRRNYTTCDYGETMRMREEVHNPIYDDLKEQGLL